MEESFSPHTLSLCLSLSTPSSIYTSFFWAQLSPPLQRHVPQFHHLPLILISDFLQLSVYVTHPGIQVHIVLSFTGKKSNKQSALVPKTGSKKN